MDITNQLILNHTGPTDLNFKINILPVVSLEPVSNETLDSDVLLKMYDILENFIHLNDWKLTNEESDMIFDYLDNLLYHLFPNREWKNYN